MTALGTETYSSYLDLDEEVKPYLQIPEANKTGDARLSLFIDGACQQVQQFMGGPLAPTTYTPLDGIGKFDGAGSLNSGYIRLPKTPVIEVIKVIEYQSNNGVALSEIDPSTGGDGYQLNYRTGLLTRVLGGIWNRPFYPGSQNVWVWWQAGYDPIPADIRIATLELVADWWRSTQQQKGGNQPPGNDQFAEAPQPMWAGIPPRIRGSLERYAMPGIK